MFQKYVKAIMDLEVLYGSQAVTALVFAVAHGKSLEDVLAEVEAESKDEHAKMSPILSPLLKEKTVETLPHMVQ